MNNPSDFNVYYVLYDEDCMCVYNSPAEALSPEANDPSCNLNVPKSLSRLNSKNRENIDKIFAAIIEHGTEVKQKR